MEYTYGAMVERGEISGAEGGKYRVRSLSREGITTPPLPADKGIVGLSCAGDGEIAIEYEEYAVGDRVYFFLFPDGKGRIVGRIED